MIEVTVPNAEQLRTDLGITRARLLADLKTEIRRIAVDVSGHVKDKKLSGQALKVQSGRLRRSINFRLSESETGINATVGTNVEYARFHEFGFNGTVNVKEYMRNKKMTVKVRGQATYDKNGKMRMGRLRKMELIGDVYTVRAHTRKVNAPERSFLRSTMIDMRAGIDQRIARVVGQSIASGVKGDLA